MRLPHLKITIRRMLLVVGGIALLLGVIAYDVQRKAKLAAEEKVAARARLQSFVEVVKKHAEIQPDASLMAQLSRAKKRLAWSEGLVKTGQASEESVEGDRASLAAIEAEVKRRMESGN